MIAMLNYGVDNEATSEGPDPTETEVMAKWLSEFIRDDEGLRLLNEANQRIIVALLLKLSNFGVAPREVIAEISAVSTPVEMVGRLRLFRFAMRPLPGWPR